MTEIDSLAHHHRDAGGRPDRRLRDRLAGTEEEARGAPVRAPPPHGDDLCLDPEDSYAAPAGHARPAPPALGPRRLPPRRPRRSRRGARGLRSALRAGRSGATPAATTCSSASSACPTAPAAALETDRPVRRPRRERLTISPPSGPTSTCPTRTRPTCSTSSPAPPIRSRPRRCPAGGARRCCAGPTWTGPAAASRASTVRSPASSTRAPPTSTGQWMLVLPDNQPHRRRHRRPPGAGRRPVELVPGVPRRRRPGDDPAADGPAGLGHRPPARPAGAVVQVSGEPDTVHLPAGRELVLLLRPRPVPASPNRDRLSPSPSPCPTAAQQARTVQVQRRSTVVVPTFIF